MGLNSIKRLGFCIRENNFILKRAWTIKAIMDLSLLQLLVDHQILIFLRNSHRFMSYQETKQSHCSRFLPVEMTFGMILPCLKRLQYPKFNLLKKKWGTGRNNKYAFSHSSGGQNTKIKCQQVWFPLRPFFLACRWLSATCIFTWFVLCPAVWFCKIWNTAIPPMCLHVIYGCPCATTAELKSCHRDHMAWKA